MKYVHVNNFGTFLFLLFAHCTDAEELLAVVKRRAGIITCFWIPDFCYFLIKMG